jgi:hypothetical protein
VETENGRNGSHCVENLLWKEIDISCDGLRDDDDDDYYDNDLITGTILFFSFKCFRALSKNY